MEFFRLKGLGEWENLRWGERVKWRWGEKAMGRLGERAMKRWGDGKNWRNDEIVNSD